MDQLSLGRRQLLRHGTATIATAGVVGTAGCLESLLGGGGKYHHWLPDPESFGNERETYDVIALDYAAFAEHEDDLEDADRFSGHEEQWEPIDIDWEDVELLLVFQDMAVLEAKFDKRDAIEELEDDDFDDADVHEGFDIYTSSEGTRAFAVGSNKLVIGGSYFGGSDDLNDIVDNLETVLDTKVNGEDRYVDESEDLSTLVKKSTLGALTRIDMMEPVEEDMPEHGRFKNNVGRSVSWTITGETTEGTWVLLFEDEDDVDTGDIEDWIDNAGGGYTDIGGWDDPAIATDGRAAVVTATKDTDELFQPDS